MAGNTYSRISLKLFIHPLFLTCFAIFLIVEGLQKSGYNYPWIHWYINDLIAMPILLSFSLFLERFTRKTPALNYDFYRILAAFIMVSVSFEVLFPLLSNEYTADIFDVVAYAFGSWAYYKLARPPKAIKYLEALAK